MVPETFPLFLPHVLHLLLERCVPDLELLLLTLHRVQVHGVPQLFALVLRGIAVAVRAGRVALLVSILQQAHRLDDVGPVIGDQIPE